MLEDTKLSTYAIDRHDPNTKGLLSITRPHFRNKGGFSDESGCQRVRRAKSKEYKYEFVVVRPSKIINL